MYVVWGEGEEIKIHKKSPRTRNITIPRGVSISITNLNCPVIQYAATKNTWQIGFPPDPLSLGRGWQWPAQKAGRCLCCESFLGGRPSLRFQLWHLGCKRRGPAQPLGGQDTPLREGICWPGFRSHREPKGRHSCMEVEVEFLKAGGKGDKCPRSGAGGAHTAKLLPAHTHQLGALSLCPFHPLERQVNAFPCCPTGFLYPLPS